MSLSGIGGTLITSYNTTNLKIFISTDVIFSSSIEEGGADMLTFATDKTRNEIQAEIDALQVLYNAGWMDDEELEARQSELMKVLDRGPAERDLYFVASSSTRYNFSS